MKKCKLVQNIMNFKFCYIIFCTIICFIVLSVPTFAKENSDNVIRVGSFEETYNVVNEKGERSGYGYEYLQDIAGYAGWTYKYITSDWKNCFTQLENGEIDILGDISYTDERAENMLFSDMPMGEEKYYIYTDASNMDLTAGNLDSFEGKNIGVFKDHIPEDVLNEWELKYGLHTQHVNASNTAEVNGPSHEQGGVPYGPNAEVEGGEALMTDADNAYVFSDTLKYNGTTFADLAKPLMKHKGYLESSLPVKSMMLGRMLSLTDRSTYAIDRNTNSRNAEKANADLQRTNAQIAAIQNELAQLYNLQESMKAESGMEAEPIEVRCGGKIRRYYDGGQIVNSLVPTYDIQRNNSLGSTTGQEVTFTSNDKTQIQNPLTTIQQSLRCGGRTRKYAGGGFISPGFVSEVGGNLIGGISQLITNKGLIDRMESMRVPETPLMDRIELETDINTDAEIGDINNTVRSLEKYITSNSSNSQVARQSILLARTQGSRMRSRVKQDEHNKEVELRNRSRMANAEIAARNSQIRAENEANKFNHQMEIVQRRSQQGAAIGDMIASLGRSIGTAYQSKFDMENLQTANLISVLKDDKSRDYIFDNMPKDTLMRMFGISSLKDLKKIQGGSTVPKRSLRTKRLNRRGSVVPDAVTMPDYYYNFA